MQALLPSPKKVKRQQAPFQPSSPALEPAAILADNAQLSRPAASDISAADGLIPDATLDDVAAVSAPSENATDLDEGVYVGLFVMLVQPSSVASPADHLRSLQSLRSTRLSLCPCKTWTWRVNPLTVPWP